METKTYTFGRHHIKLPDNKWNIPFYNIVYFFCITVEESCNGVWCRNRVGGGKLSLSLSVTPCRCRRSSRASRRSSSIGCRSLLARRSSAGLWWITCQDPAKVSEEKPYFNQRPSSLSSLVFDICMYVLVHNQKKKKLLGILWLLYSDQGSYEDTWGLMSTMKILRSLLPNWT